MDDTGRLGCRGTLRDCPGPGLLRPRGEVGLQAQGVEADSRQRVEAGLVLADRLQELEGFIIGEFAQLCLELGVEEHCLGRGDEVLHPLDECCIAELGLVDIDDVDEWLGGEKEELAQRSRVDTRREDRGALIKEGPRLLSGSDDCGLRLVGARLLLEPRDRLVEGLDVGEDELGVDRLHVLLRGDTALDVHNIVIGERSQDLADRIGFADIREELIAKARALARTLHDAGDVDEHDGRRQEPLRTEDAGEHVEPRVRNPDHAGVRLDRRERVVRGEDIVLRQGIEEGRLPDVRESDDADRERQGAIPFFSRPREVRGARAIVGRGSRSAQGKG